MSEPENSGEEKKVEGAVFFESPPPAGFVAEASAPDASQAPEGGAPKDEAQGEARPATRITEGLLPTPSTIGDGVNMRESYAVSLEMFEGPLDLLLHLVRRHELDILDIPIAFVTEKYIEYLEFARALDLEIAGEYLVMAATLAYLKSRELLPPDLLVLPAHGNIYEGLHERLTALIDWHEVALERLYELCDVPRRAVDVFPALFKSEITDRTYFPATGESIAHLHCSQERRMLTVEEDEDGVAWWRQA